MPCIDCLEKCNGIITPDKCVQYTGEDREVFGICQGDSLFEVEEIILDTLETLMDGTGIIITGLTGCSLINNILLNQTPTAVVLFQTLFTATCSLQAQINVLSAIVNSGYVFDTSCLVGVTPTSSRDQILQATISKTCDNDSRITAIEVDYVKNSDLCNLVQTCISGGGGSDYNLRMVPYAPIPYIGSLANFDNTGAGIAAAGFDKVYLMNGLNGTQDWRGRSPIGAIQNVPGGTLDPAVDPTLPANVGTNYVLNQKVGASSVILTIPQIPAHSHSVIDLGHRHGVQSYSGTGAASPHIVSPTSAAGAGTNTAVAVTGITIGSAGGGLAHTNLQPSAACYYIVYIP